MGKRKRTRKIFSARTSYTTDTRKKRWGIERIALDGISNHLPDDSRGTVVSVKLKQDGAYVDLKEADRARPIEEIVFEDDGGGYDNILLSLAYSDKDNDVLSVGQFGEGLKMVAAACLRLGQEVKYKSKNWTAVPFGEPQPIKNHEGNNVERVCFRITENGTYITGSRTIFRNPSGEIIAEIYRLPEKVLGLRRKLSPDEQLPESASEDAKWVYRELHKKDVRDAKAVFGRSIYQSRIIDAGLSDPEVSTWRALFVKGVFIREEDSLFDYDLGIEDISPDRIYGNEEAILMEIESLLKNCKNPEVIEAVLRHANTSPRSNCYEFQALSREQRRRSNGMISETKTYDSDAVFDGKSRKKKIKPFYESETEGIASIIRLPTDRTELERLLGAEELERLLRHGHDEWAKGFKRLFGENAVLSSGDVNVDEDARIMGHTPVKLNSAVADYLAECGVKNARSIEVGKEYRWVPTEELSDEEKAVLARADEISEIAFGDKNPLEIRVYSGLYLSTGREIDCATGVIIFEDDGKRVIGIKRSQLASLEGFTRNYVHERGHDKTGADDWSRTFTNLGYEISTRLIIEKLRQGQSQAPEYYI